MNCREILTNKGVYEKYNSRLYWEVSGEPILLESRSKLEYHDHGYDSAGLAVCDGKNWQGCKGKKDDYLILQRKLILITEML